MKIMFVLVSCLLAVSLSVMSAIIATGKVPFKAADEPDKTASSEEEKIVAGSEKANVSVFAGQAGVVDELVKELKTRIQKQEEAEKELALQRKEFESKMVQMQILEKKLAELKSEVSDKIVQIGSNEEGNFKKLAEMYGKMEPESASELLQKSAPDRAAKIISLIGERQAAAIMNAAVAMGESGASRAAEWSDAMRRMNNQKGAQL